LTTERLVAKIDRDVTYTNGLTSGFLDRGKQPIALPSDQAAIEVAFSRLSPEQRSRPRVARIHDTLHLSSFEVTEALLSESRRPLTITGEPAFLEFGRDGQLLPRGIASEHAHVELAAVG
ncbi:MAG TPA: hypothetical protein VMP10_01285, partial [Chloroflexota bacterium]|nr:hypothetical protein [Chloroflexota bacterium]